ncbi:MAG: hypothetical protein ABI220_02820 [Candidatus Saccharimonadales bacterium]
MNNPNFGSNFSAKVNSDSNTGLWAKRWTISVSGLVGFMWLDGAVEQSSPVLAAIFWTGKAACFGALVISEIGAFSQMRANQPRAALDFDREFPTIIGQESGLRAGLADIREEYQMNQPTGDLE